MFDFARFWHGITDQAAFTTGGLAIGETQRSGFVYYAWAATWGLGWIPCVLAAAGGALLVARDRWVAAVLIAAPVVYIVVVGSQTKYFGRWLLPIFPMAVLTAAYGAVRLADLCSRRRRHVRAVAVGVAVVAASLQSAVHVLHDDRVMSHASTNSLAHDWIVRHIPPGSRVAVEPFPANGLLDRPARQYVAVSGIPGIPVSALGPVYGSLLRPQILDSDIRQGFCWLVTGSLEAGRVFVDRKRFPAAVAYYRALAARGMLMFRASPFAAGRRVGVGTGPVAYQYDWSYDFYPLVYRSPGGIVSVYRLHGGRCGRA